MLERAASSIFYTGRCFREVDPAGDGSIAAAPGSDREQSLSWPRGLAFSASQEEIREDVEPCSRCPMH